MLRGGGFSCSKRGSGKGCILAAGVSGRLYDAITNDEGNEPDL